MLKPQNCPQCGALGDEISDAYDMRNLFGLGQEEAKKWVCNKCGHNFDEDTSGRITQLKLSKMSLMEIAGLILEDWRNINAYALPYVEAMDQIKELDDQYGADNGRTIVMYFLSNAKNWKGPVAREVKIHLRKLLEESAG